MNHKIYLCGPSGSGKTRLAKALSSELGIPFVTTSAKTLWDGYGIKTHKELLDLSTTDPMLCLKFQWDLLKLREDTLREHRSFVTDRSPVDNWVYFLLQNSMNLSQQDCFRYKLACEKNFPEDGKLIYVTRPFSAQLEDDGMRINNIFYQTATQAVFDYAVASKNTYNWVNDSPINLDINLQFNNYAANFYRTNHWEFDEKLKSVIAWLNVKR